MSMRPGSAKIWLSEDIEAFMRFVQATLDIQQKNPLDLATLKAQDIKLLAGPDGESKAVFGDGRQDYMMQRYKNLALINISGTLVKNDSYYNRYYGQVSYDEIRRSTLMALQDKSIDGITLMMNTPGGAASGADAMASFFGKTAKTKALYTFAESDMCSGGYYLGAPSHEIYAQRAAQIGSIGVIMVHYDYLKMYQEAGVTPTVFRAGEFKALGSSVEHLDKKATAKIEEMLQDYYSMFLDHVVENRDYSSVAELKESAAEGRVFFAEEAKEVGLVDHVADFEEALEEMSEKAGSNAGRRSQFAVNQKVQPRGTAMSKKAQAAAASGQPLSDEQIAALASGAEPGVVATAAPSASETEGQEADPASDEPTAAAEEATAEPAEADAPATQAAAPSADMMDKVIALSTELGATKVALKAAELAETKLREEMTVRDAQLAEVVVVARMAVTNLQVALGYQPSVTDGMSAEQVVELHTKLRADFTGRFKPGAKAEPTRQAVAAVTDTPVSNATRKLTNI